jgi:hypothetical protein
MANKWIQLPVTGETAVELYGASREGISGLHHKEYWFGARGIFEEAGFFVLCQPGFNPTDHEIGVFVEELIRLTRLHRKMEDEWSLPGDYVHSDAWFSNCSILWDLHEEIFGVVEEVA